MRILALLISWLVTPFYWVVMSRPVAWAEGRLHPPEPLDPDEHQRVWQVIRLRATIDLLDELAQEDRWYPYRAQPAHLAARLRELVRAVEED